MALFKISKGTAAHLKTNRPYANEGNAYFTIDDGKFYIDIAGDGTSATPVITPSDAGATDANINRVPLNANKADTATNLAAAGTWTWTNGTISGPTASLNIGGQTTNIDAIPSASATQSGIITTGAQTFAGNKTFSNLITLNGGADIKSTGNAIFHMRGVSTTVDYINIYIDGGSNSNRPMVLQNGYGNIGIGNIIAPTEKVEVQGNVKATTFIGNLQGNATTATRLNITSTDHAVARFDGTNGIIQNSGVLINDANDLTTEGNFYSKGYYVSNCNIATTSPYQFGFYQWNNEFQFTFRNSNNVYIGQAFGIDGASGKSRWSQDATYDSGVNIYPVTNNTDSVGLSDHKFADMYATTFHGALDGNANTATRATRTPYLETWRSNKTDTYGASYPLYAWWRTGSHLKLVCDGYTVETDYANCAGRLDVVSIDNAIARFNGTNGTVQNSGVIIDDSNNVTVPGTVKIGQCTLQYNSTTSSLDFIF